MSNRITSHCREIINILSYFCISLYYLESKYFILGLNIQIVNKVISTYYFPPLINIEEFINTADINQESLFHKTAKITLY
jgi:hypothetical protein